MAKVHGGCLAIRLLKQEGVKYLFGLSGGHINPFFDACMDEGIEVIDTRHEQAAAHMADGWARATGRPGVAAVTAGPGVTDAVTGVANAYEAASPIIVFGGRSPQREFELGSIQDMDQVKLMTPITKWARSVHETRRIPEFLSMAFRHALAGRPGPVYLEIPQDILQAEIDEEQVVMPRAYRTEARPYGDPAMVKAAVELLLKAKRPVIIAGSGVWWSGAGAELQEFIETMRLPLVLIGMGRGVVPEDHPLCFGPTRVGVREADVVLLIATRLNYNLAFGRPPLFAEDVKMGQIDIEAGEVGRNRPIEVGMVGDVKGVLRQMTEEARERGGRKDSPWVEQCQAYARSRQERLRAELYSDKVPIHPLRLCREIADFLDRDATLVMDGGDITVFGATVLRVYEPGHWLDNGPLGCLGPGLPFALAAKLARPDKQVLLLSGDGSFGLNGMEMDTAIRHKLPVVVVIGNDAAWGMVKHEQEDHYGRTVGTELRLARYDKMVEALGGHGEYVERPQDIRPALERAFASGLPACVNVRVDPTAVTGRRVACRRG